MVAASAWSHGLLAFNTPWHVAQLLTAGLLANRLMTLSMWYKTDGARARLAEEQNAAVDARLAPLTRRSTSRMKSSSGVSATRDESARHATAVRPMGAVTHFTVATCAASVAARTAAFSA